MKAEARPTRQGGALRSGVLALTLLLSLSACEAPPPPAPAGPPPPPVPEGAPPSGPDDAPPHVPEDAPPSEPAPGGGDLSVAAPPPPDPAPGPRVGIVASPFRDLRAFIPFPGGIRPDPPPHAPSPAGPPPVFSGAPSALVGAVERYHYAGDSWDASERAQDFAFAFLAPLTEAPEAGWGRRFGAGDPPCQAGWPAPPPSLSLADGAGVTATLSQPEGPAIGLEWAPLAGGLVAAPLPPRLLKGPYTLSFSRPPPGFPEAMADVLVPNQSSFVLVEPGIQTENRAPPPPIHRAQVFRWRSEAGAGQRAWILLGRLDGSGRAYDAIVTCNVEIAPSTTGEPSFTLPGGLWETWPAGRTMHVMVGRVTSQTSLDGRATFSDVFWLIGKATTAAE